MYRTSKGNRTLGGAERELYVASLAMLTDFLSDGNDFEIGIAVFDDLTRNQKIAVLHGVSLALLRDNVAAPQLTAFAEGTVAAVYQNLHDRLADELDPDFAEFLDGECGGFEVPEDAGYRSWRTLVLDACRETTDLVDLPEADDRELSEWDFLIDVLRDRILWDEDWQMLEHLDANPEVSQRIKQELGVDEDYFVAVPPDPTDKEAERMLTELRHMTPEGRGL